MKFLVFFLTLLGVCLCQTYRLNSSHSGGSFFDGWSFFTGDDPTHGCVDYVDRAKAESLGLISFPDGKVKISADSKNSYPQGRGRPSVRLESKTAYNSGLFILDLDHMPTGPGTWPAWWACGKDWPNNGEIDILEGIDGLDFNAITLHTNQGCSMHKSFESYFTGHWAPAPGGVATDCWVGDPNQYSNQGCSIQANSGTFGPKFNQVGGVFALEWVRDGFIRGWVFLRNQVPSDITSGDPNPQNWGKPVAYFPIGSNCPSRHFNFLNVVINLTFCGDWAGNNYPGGLAACNNVVRNSPQKYQDAYWLINYVKVYQR